MLEDSRHDFQSRARVVYKVKGRTKWTPEVVDRLLSLLESGLTIEAASKEIGISRHTVRRALWSLQKYGSVTPPNPR
jgi:response regulator of citrate/malate metabolism